MSWWVIPALVGAAAPTIPFNRLLGTYIAIFFVVSHAVAFLVFGDHPTPSTVLGGVLVVLGAASIQVGAATP